MAAVMAYPPVLGLGGDQCPEAAGFASQNYRHLRDSMDCRGLGHAPAAGLARWDARLLPLRDACVDVGIVDLPFGKKHRAKGGSMLQLYQRAFREFARVVRCVRACVRACLGGVYIGEGSRGGGRYETRWKTSPIVQRPTHAHTVPADGCSSSRRRGGR